MARSRFTAFITSLSFFVIAALIAGVGVGAFAQSTHLPWLTATLGVVESLGQVWLNALRITVMPLVFSLLVTGIISIADAAATGRIAGRALMVFAVLLVGATVYAMLAGLGLLAIWPIDPEAGRDLLAGVSTETAATVGAAAHTDGLRAFLNSLAPSNLIKAAADDGVLAVVVFAVAFGFAATRIRTDLRRPLAGFFEAVAETMVVIVHWVLLAAPFGVFALALGVGLRAGLGVAGTLAHYVAILCLSQLGLILLTYVVAVVWGRVSLGRFARAVAPAQVVAVSTQSSLASLPVMIERARDWLGVPQATGGLVLPLAVAVFRITSPVANLGVCLYVAQLHGIELSLGVLVAGGLTALAVSIASVGLPGQVSFFASVGPIALAMGLPLEMLPLLLAVEVIPDIFRTVGNVTADLAVTRIVQGVDAAPPTGAAS